MTFSALPTEFHFPEDELKLKEIPVTLGKGKYTLREADEDAACKWRNATMSKMKMEDGKFSGSDGIADVEPLLVGSCLFNGDGKAVGEAFIRTLPARIVKPLFDWIQEVSGLKEKEPGKEELNSTLANSA